MIELVKMATEQPTIAIVAERNPKGFLDSIASIVSETIQISGKKDITNEDKAFLIMKTKEEIEREYRFLTGAEVRYAFDQGVRGRYGDYYNINLLTFIKWLDKYLDSDARQNIIAKRQVITPVTHQLSESNPVSDRDMAELYRQRADYLYRKYLETGRVSDIANISSLNKMFEKFVLTQLKNDRKASMADKTLDAVFEKYKLNGKSSIYQEKV